MKRIIWCGLLWCCVLQPWATARATPSLQIFQSERFGKLHVVRETAVPRAAAIFFTGDDGWSKTSEAFAIRLAVAGYFVIGVDTPAYRKIFREDDEQCYYLAGEVERLSQSVQSGAKLPQYYKPLLFGYSAGASVVYAVLAQHDDAFLGGVLLSFCDFFDASKNFCPGDQLRSKALRGGRRKKVRLEPVPEIQGKLIVYQGAGDTECPYARAKAFFSQMPTAAFHTLDGSGHQVMIDPDFRKGFDEVLAGFRELEPRTENLPLHEENSLGDLPLVELTPSGTEKNKLIIFLSGDGGWASIDKEVGQLLAADGFFVVGFSSLKYFWKEKTPEQTAGDIQRIIEYYHRLYPAKEIVLAGYSMGAEILPFIVNRLSPPTKEMVQRLVLLAPEAHADFEVHISAWVGFSEVDHRLPVLPELENAKVPHVVCIYGEDEADESACPLIAKRLGKAVSLPGGHHFQGDYDRVGAEILKFMNESVEITPKS